YFVIKNKDAGLIPVVRIFLDEFDKLRQPGPGFLKFTALGVQIDPMQVKIEIIQPFQIGIPGIKQFDDLTELLKFFLKSIVAIEEKQCITDVVNRFHIYGQVGLLHLWKFLESVDKFQAVPVIILKILRHIIIPHIGLV